MEDKCNGYTPYNLLPSNIERDWINGHKTDYIIRNASYFRPMDIPVKTISLLQDLLPDNSEQLSVCNKSDIVVFNSPYTQSHYIDKITSKTINITKNRNKIITSFKILSKNSSKSFLGFFKFGGDYYNELFLHTKNKIIKISRVFSPPENLKLPISVFTNKSHKVYKTGVDNCFENFFLKVLANIKKKKNNIYVKDIIFDNSYRDKISN